MPSVKPTKPATRRKPSPGSVPVSADLQPVRVCTSDDYVDPRDLRSLEKNPRALTPEKRASLVKSVRELGLFRPLLAWRDEAGEAVVIGGNQRLPILQELVAAGTPLVHEDGTRALGVPVTWFRGSEAQARVVALRDNNSDGDWDYPALTEYVADLRALGAGAELLALAGFDDGVLADLAGAYPAPGGEVVPAPTPAPPAPPAPPTPTGPLQDPAEQLVGVQIGHIRGKIKAPTYERLVKALTEGLANGIPEGGLDAAFSALLARLP